MNRDQAHYLFAVMRQAPGEAVQLFNGRDGTFSARIIEAGRKGGTLVCDALLAPLVLPPDLWLLFAPVKKARTDFIVEKAVEMGVRRIQPVQTQHTSAERVRADRMRAHLVEAAEQCGANVVPDLGEMRRLDQVLDEWPAERSLAFCDETARDTPAGLAGAVPGRWAILIGPEGGFSPQERARLAELPQAWRLSLGPRILRADTAAVAALTLWQAALGDWVRG